MKLKLPYKFKGFLTQMLLKEKIIRREIKINPLAQVTNNLGQDSLKGFSTIYTNVLQAMADFDYDYLSSIMEPTLYARTEKGLNEIKEGNFKLEYLEQDIYDPDASDSEEEILGTDTKKSESNKVPKWLTSGPLGSVYYEKDLQLYIEAKGAYGVDIQRSLNKGKTGLVRGQAVSVYKGDKFSLKEIWSKQILILNVYYFTTRRLILRDEEGDLLIGSENMQERYDHKFRFETYTNKIDWVLTDIDETLKGNDFIPVEKVEEETA